MRLASSEINAIKTYASEVFGPDVTVRLFGSRVNDNARGGDIDLHIEVRDPTRSGLEQEIRFLLKLKESIGDRKIDLVVHLAGKPFRLIDVIAMEDGVSL